MTLRSLSFPLAFPLAPLALSLFLGLSVLTPTSAAAEEPTTMGQDEVTLKNGGTIRGTVVSTEPGVSVKIIELGQTEVRTIPWAQVGDVERGKFAPKAATEVQVPRVEPGSAGPGYARPVPVPAPTEGAKIPVRLHIDSPVPAQVFSHQRSYGYINGYGFSLDRATPVCTSPCDEVFDAATGESYTVKGEFSSAPSFTLVGRTGDMELTVSPGSRGARVGGIVLTAVGGGGILGGGMLALLGALAQSDANATGVDNSNSALVTPGLAVAGLGAAALVIGIVVIVTNKTEIDLHPMNGGGHTAVAPRPRYWAGEF